MTCPIRNPERLISRLVEIPDVIDVSEDTPKMKDNEKGDFTDRVSGVRS